MAKQIALTAKQRRGARRMYDDAREDPSEDDIGYAIGEAPAVAAGIVESTIDWIRWLGNHARLVRFTTTKIRSLGSGATFDQEQYRVFDFRGTNLVDWGWASL